MDFPPKASYGAEWKLKTPGRIMLDIYGKFVQRRKQLYDIVFSDRFRREGDGFTGARHALLNRRSSPLSGRNVRCETPSAF